MPSSLSVSIGQASDRGVKAENQDFHGAVAPEEPTRSLKGVALALADGISTSPVSRIAAETSVRNFLTDYYCTTDAWTAQTAATQVIKAINGWLYSETQRSHHAYDINRGYVCTFAALILKGRTAHLLHSGDSRIYRVSGDSLEQLTRDHRNIISEDEDYLGRAIGMAERIDVDYRAEPLSPGDIFLLTTDGVHDVLSARDIAGLVKAHRSDLDKAAHFIIAAALKKGSQDNLTVQIACIDALPDGDALEFVAQTNELPLPPALTLPCDFAGYRLIREIHSNHRSRIYFGHDLETGDAVALKVPATDIIDEPVLLRQFMMEEWIARRVDNPHILKAHLSGRPRKYLYVVTEYFEGQSLREWMDDHPSPNLIQFRDIVDQIIKGIRALHRKEMVHGDLRPENVMIDQHGTIKIIDFGSVRVAGIDEGRPRGEQGEVLGTVQYTAPECLVGEPPSRQADLYSLGTIAYELLTGKLPYGAQAARLRQRNEIARLQYNSARTPETAVPDWIDGALRKAVHPDPLKRYSAFSEFSADLHTPNKRFMLSRQAPLAERDPVLFWKGVSLVLALILLVSVLTR